MGGDSETFLDEIKGGSTKVKVGKLVFMDGHPCKVESVSTSKTGKHGHVKVKGRAASLIDKTKHDFVLDSHAHPKAPCTTKNEYFLMDIDLDNGFWSLLDEENVPLDTLKFDEDVALHAEIKEAFDKVCETGEGEVCVQVSKMPYSRASAGMQEKYKENSCEWIFTIDEFRVKDD